MMLSHSHSGVHNRLWISDPRARARAVSRSISPLISISALISPRGVELVLHRHDVRHRGHRP